LSRRIRQTTSDGSSGTWQVTEDLKFVSDPLLFGRHIAELRASDNTLVRSYLWGLDLSETMDGAGGVSGLLWVTLHPGSGAPVGTHFCAYDGNGNIVALSAASDGSVNARYEYGPFGEPIRLTGPAAALNRFRFSTKRTCNTTELVLYEHRAYSPTLGRWPSRHPLGDGAFFALYVAGKSRKEQRQLYRESLEPLQVFVRNAAVNYTDAQGLRIDAAWCQRWLNDCTRDNLLDLRSCLECMGPSVGLGTATCAIGCLPFIAGGPVAYGICFLVCSGMDGAVFAIGASWCLDAFADGMKGCKEGYERCMDRVAD